MSAAKSLQSLLDEDNGRTAGIVRRAEKLARLDRWFRGLLPENLRPHCAVGNIKHNRIVVYADAPVWASRLRYLEPELRRLLREHLGDDRLDGLDVHVRPASGPMPTARRHCRASMSTDTAKIIEATADSVGDGALGRALRRLARHARDQ